VGGAASDQTESISDTGPWRGPLKLSTRQKQEGMRGAEKKRGRTGNDFRDGQSHRKWSRCLSRRGSERALASRRKD